MKEKCLKIKDIQAVSFEILEYFDRVCQDLGLSYFLAYGTLIGCIRHKDYIPWDDDVDIWMPRSDFEILLKYFDNNGDETLPYKLCRISNTINYTYGISRLSDMRYKYVTKNSEKNYDIGVFIDIYPLDNYGNTMEECQKLYDSILLYNRMYSIFINPQCCDSVLKKVVKFVISSMIAMVNFMCYIDMEKLINNKLKNVDKKSRYVGVPVWDTYGCMPFERYIFEKVIYKEFAGKKFPVPAEYDKILKIIYGDYMKLPPVDKRVPSHDYQIYRR